MSSHARKTKTRPLVTFIPLSSPSLTCPSSHLLVVYVAAVRAHPLSFPILHIHGRQALRAAIAGATGRRGGERSSLHSAQGEGRAHRHEGEGGHSQQSEAEEGQKGRSGVASHCFILMDELLCRVLRDVG